MKKKMVSILTAAFCVSALLAGCGFADTAKTSASSAGAASSSTDGTTTFTVGFDAEYPPYGYMDDETGDYTGFDLELAEAVCEIYGWKLVKTPINWDAKDTELNSGAIDCIWNGFTMNGREDDYTWSDPYVDNSQVMVVSENSGINSLSDLAGKTVGVQAASAALDLLQSQAVADACPKAQGGRIDAVEFCIEVAFLIGFRKVHGSVEFYAVADSRASEGSGRQGNVCHALRVEVHFHIHVIENMMAF